jgi:streptomycin 6-kinase
MLVPPTFAQTTVTREGAAGRAWLASLAGVVDELLTRWSCTPDGDTRHGGVGLVVPVSSAHGHAVIKVSFPHESNGGEARALRLLDGAAAVRLYAHDQDRWAMLLERADGPGPEHVLDSEESVQMMADLSTRLAVLAGPQIVRLADTASGWRRQLDQQLTHAPPGTVSPASLARAREAIDLVASDSTTTLLHGDLHEGNVLGAEREPWLTIDLKGWAGTAAFDAYTVALTRHRELRHVSNPTRLVRERIRQFASTARVDPHLAIEIAYARTVSSLLYETVTQANTFGRHLLDQLVTSPL